MTDDFIFVPNEGASKNKTEETKYYTVLGNQEFLDEEEYPRVNADSKDAYAKSVSYNGQQKYYIKVGVYGKIFNPFGMFSEGKANKFLSKIGKDEFQMKQVNPNVFGYYINFLRTKNTAWLNNAQRELQ